MVALPTSVRHAFLLPILSACADGTGPAQTDMETVSGDGQVSVVGTQLPDPLVVRVTGANGVPVSGVAVFWEVLSGAGSFDSPTTTTNETGAASNTWTLGPNVGQQTARAGAVDLPQVQFSAEAVAGELFGVAVLPSVDTAFALLDTVQYSVQGLDRFGNPTTPPEVAWSSSDASIVQVLSDGRAVSIADGEAFVIAQHGAMADSAILVIDRVPATFTLGPDSAVAYSGDQVQYELATADSNGFAMNKLPFWSTSDTIAAPIDSLGTVTVRSTGNIRVVARIAGFADSVTLLARPDEQLVFEGHTSSGGFLFLSASDASLLFPFADVGGAPARWSRGGDFMAIRSRDRNAIVILDGRLSTRTEVGRSDSLKLVFGVAWSPDDSQIAFSAEPFPRSTFDVDIYAVRADGTGLRRLLDTPDAEFLQDWSPDGSKLLVASNRLNPPSSEYLLFSVDIATGDAAQLTPSDVLVGSADYSSDGTEIIFERRWNQGRDIFRMSSDGSDLTQLTTDGTSHSPTWSPDAQSIAFTCDDDQGEFQLCSMTREGSQRRRLTALRSAQSPSWGRRIR